VLAAPIYSVNPVMGSYLIIVVFAVVVIGGMGSILGSILTGFGLGVVEGLTKVFYPGSLQHRDLHHHGDRADAAPAGPVRNTEVEAPWKPATTSLCRCSPPWWRSGWWHRSSSIPCS
jgi:hypothetical protein